MEGQEGMKLISPLKGESIGSKQIILVGIIVLFHLVGLIGLSIPSTRHLFLSLVPYHLFLMLAVIVISHQNIGSKLLLFVLCLIVLGYIAEWIGVNKHWLFGNYYYGNTLSIKVFGVPLIIGVNWFLLTYSAGVLMQRSRLKSVLLRIIAGALLLVLLDILIEPVAMRFDYWHWTNNIIPFKNYTCWFFTGIVMLLIFEQFRFKKQSIAGPVLLGAQFVFFIVLHWS